MSAKQTSTSLICAPITETRASDFINSIEEASKIADAIELRLDYLDESDLIRVLNSLPRIALTTPLIFTFRPREQGGKKHLSLLDRQNFWRGLPEDVTRILGYADFEIDLAESFYGDSPIPWSKVICSWHNFEETPDEIGQVYGRIARTPAAVIKIATQANRIDDCLKLFELVETGDRSRPVIVLGMGMAGLVTRVLGLSRGTMLTFGALRRGSESASGQPTVDELKNLYRAKEISKATEVYGVIGKPIGHSRSPIMHNAALRALARDGVYLPLEVDDIDSFIRDFVRPATRKIDWNLRGLSVTIPHKLGVIPHLDYLDETAGRIGAVNTLVIAGEELHGYNSDAPGAMKPLDELIDVRGARVALIGAGGSARAVCYGLKQRGADVIIYARDPAKSRALAAEFQAAAESIDSFNGGADLLINCTPIGMSGHSEGQSPVKADSLRGVRLVYDLIYNPRETALLRDAKAAGCGTLGGLSMLVAQAAEQFRLWTGDRAPVSVMSVAVGGER